MKKFFRFILVFALVFTLSINVVNATIKYNDPDEPALIANAPVVSVLGNNNTLILSWNAEENATSYIISRSTNAKKGFKIIKTTTDTTYTDTKLTYGTTYYYKVTAKNDYNYKMSNVVYRKVVPNRVVINEARPYSTRVRLAYSQTNNSGYYIYRSTNKKTWTKIATINKNSTVAYLDKNLKSNTKYYYQVQAFQKVGSKTIVTGSKSEIVEVTTAIAVPAVKQLSSYVYEIDLQITGVAGGKRYEVYSSMSKDSGYELAETIYPSDFYKGKYVFWEYVDVPYQNHYYKVRACTETLCSDFRTIGAHSYLPKTNIWSLKANAKSATVRFDYIGGADGFQVYRSTSKNGKYTKVATIPYGFDSEYTDKKVKSGKTYYYKVRSFIKVNGKFNYSAFSSVRSIKIDKNAGINSAMEDAKLINKTERPSKKDLISYLTSDYYGYTKNEATKGVEKAKINFNNNALYWARQAVTYFEAITKVGIKNILLDFNFTASEIKYALSKININWKAELVKILIEAKEYGVSRQAIIAEFVSEWRGYTEEQVDICINEAGMDFNQQAVVAANRYYNDNQGEENTWFSTENMRFILQESFGFTEDETAYGLENTDIDFVAEAVRAYRTIEDYNYSRSTVEGILTNSPYNFSLEELDLAFDRISVDFNAIAVTNLETILGGKYNYSVNRQSARNLLGDLDFTETEINYAIANVNTSYWVENAVKAINYMINQNDGISRYIVEYSLDQAEFTAAEIAAAITNSGIDFVEQATLKAAYALEHGTYSKSKLIETLSSNNAFYHFTAEEATAAANDESFNYDLECVEQVNSTYIGGEPTKTLAQVREELKTTYGFTDDNIDYAFANTNINDYVINE